jgi:beta-galactosidase
MRRLRNVLLPVLAALACAPSLQAGIGDYPQALAPDAPSGKEWESEQRLGLNKEKPRATFNSRRSRGTRSVRAIAGKPTRPTWTR